MDELANSLECVHRVIVKEEVGARRNLCDLDGACPERGQIGERPIRSMRRGSRAFAGMYTELNCLFI